MENPREILLNPAKITVLWSSGVIGPCFLQNEANDAVTMNGA